jgi:hypothetical protein
LSKKIFLFSSLFFIILTLTACTKFQGDGFISSNKLLEYGFFEMPRPNSITNEDFIITDSQIEYSGMMNYNDFQIYSSTIYKYYNKQEDIKVLGYLTDSTSIGLFTNLYITLGEELPLLDYENIENTSFRYCFAFSTVEQGETGAVTDVRIIYVSYSPGYSVDGNNVKITLIRKSIIAVYIEVSK